MSAPPVLKKVVGKVTMSTKLYGKDLKEYEDVDVETLLTQLSRDELEELSNMVDPDDSMVPPHLRCRDQTTKEATGPLDRKKLLDYLITFAQNQEDWPENKPYEPGIKRGKIFIPKEKPKEQDADLGIELDLDEDSESALGGATESELVDLAAILGLHSMLNQDQYHASILNKGQGLGANFATVVKSQIPKAVPMLPDNDTSVDKTVEMVYNNDAALKELNWNNIRNIPREKFKKLFEGLKNNTHLEKLHMANTALTDGSAFVLVEALKANTSLKVLNVESNYLSGFMIRDIVNALSKTQAVEEFRASNQRPQILGNKIEMEIAKLVERNETLTRLGLCLDVPDARMRITNHLQKNADKRRLMRLNSQKSDS